MTICTFDHQDVRGHLPAVFCAECVPLRVRGEAARQVHDSEQPVAEQAVGGGGVQVQDESGCAEATVRHAAAAP